MQGKGMLGKGGQRKEHARLVTRVEMCAGKKCLQMCQRALTQKRTVRSRFEPGAAYSSSFIVELPLRPSASAEAPSSPMLLRASL